MPIFAMENTKYKKLIDKLSYDLTMGEKGVYGQPRQN